MECSHKTYNIYCDESTHLENDGQPYMIYGYVSIPIQFVKASNPQLSSSASFLRLNVLSSLN